MSFTNTKKFTSPLFMAKIESFGCKHYRRKCLIITDCCKRTYPCRLCHNHNEDHKMIRHRTKYMLCLCCGMIQGASQYCVMCKVKMANYFCKICKFWTDSLGVFHCKQCKVCRVGNKKKFFHCTGCNACLPRELLNNHNHVENTLKSTCPICAEFMFESVNDVVLLNCGHSIHFTCFKIYKESSFQCPVCLKSAGDTKVLNERIDCILSNNVGLNAKRQNYMCQVSCFDCQSVSKTIYTFLYNKCAKCGSYNTRINELYKTE